VITAVEAVVVKCFRW